ncbi:MAG TPA: DUF72 domain-containing protein [Dyella sp.]|uniref:DUF72 domain-containing protein n=1 Tax=Dyella sp. TaxID=1869338 RepID=UPI002C9333E7|nr:DUF72 domain-containing protein [Dyella sp.]HTV84237.1 DUF72 domain-containing protein [Dyella sp.]
MTGRVTIGTASWTDKSLIACKRFYPKGCSSAEDRLRYYASRFPMVEVDSSYYAMPSERNSQLWAERTPDDFTFNVKAFRLFTGHQTPQVALPKDVQQEMTGYFATKKNLYYKDTPHEIREVLWQRFERALQPLRAANKLVAVHFQFPPWVTPVRKAFDHIIECRERLADYTLSTEFRLAAWFDDAHRDATLAFERQHQLAHVVLDMPQGFPNSLPPIWEVTNPALAIVRFHGRNTSTWDVKGQTAASDRFDYDYSDAELQTFAEPIRRLADQADRVQGIFNNNNEDQGQRNAETLTEFVGRLL